MRDNLTPRQTEVLDFIEDYQMNNGCSPTLREIRSHLKVSSDNSVLKHLKALVKKGMIEKSDTPRGIKLLKSIQEKLQAELISIPVLGFIPAGGPVASEEHIEDNLLMDISAVEHPRKCFGLKVKGDSMIDVGIFHGDLVLADSSIEPRAGDIVVALVDGGNTVKTYIKEGNNVYLRAENPEYSDIIPERELSIQGVVIKLIRDFT